MITVSYTHLDVYKRQLTTGSDGTATVYVKRGSYVVTATHSRFTAAVTQTVKISAGRTVKLTGEILENVQLLSLIHIFPQSSHG